MDDLAAATGRAVEELVPLRWRVTGREAPARRDEGAAEAVRMSRENAVLAEIAGVIGACVDMGAAYMAFAEQVRRIIPFDGIVVSALARDAEPTTGYAQVPGLDWRWRPGTSYPIDGAMAREAAREGRGVTTVLRDAAEVRSRYPGSIPAFQAGMRSCLSVLVGHGQEVRCVPHLLSGRSHGFMERDVVLAVRAGSQIAAAVANELLHAEWMAERGELERRLVQSEKLKTVGTAAGGIVHDLNNLLTAIICFARLGEVALPPRESVMRASFREIRSGADRASHLVRQLLSSSGRRPIDPAVLSLGGLVRDMDRLLRRLIGEHIELVTVIGTEQDMVNVDRRQIEAVLLNLAANARDAMPGGGMLTIETTSATVSGEGAGRGADLSPGEYVVQAVADTGHGLSGEARAHLFEPFFTTKGGAGTGLGLSTSRSIVAQSNGHIDVESEPGEGTIVRLHMPLADETVTDPLSSEDPGDIPTGTETVLLVEDEDIVREATARVLRSYGYRVVDVTDGEEALEVVESGEGGDIDILFADVVLPLMGGLEVAQRLASREPGLKVLLTTGYPDEALARTGVLESGVDLVRKPVTPSTLLRKVREVLDR